LPATAAAGALSGLGSIYALASNGTNNQLQVLRADLTTWEVVVSPPLGPSLIAFGQAAVVVGKTFWTTFMDDDGVYIAGFNLTAPFALTASLNASSPMWPACGAAGDSTFFFDDIFPMADGGLLVAGTAAGPGNAQRALCLFAVSDPLGSATVSLIGSLPGGGYEDLAWDPTGQLLYAIVGESDQGDSGTLSVVSLAAPLPSPPLPLPILANVTLQDHFSFPLFDANTSSLVGLTLVSSQPGGYARNLTLLSCAGLGKGLYEATSHGTVGQGLYVVLEDGPKALDPASRRAFFMLASGPFAEFDVASLSVDGVPPQVLEAPGLCGFIGYCPQVSFTMALLQCWAPRLTARSCCCLVTCRALRLHHDGRRSSSRDLPAS